MKHGNPTVKFLPGKLNCSHEYTYKIKFGNCNTLDINDWTAS